MIRNIIYSILGFILLYTIYVIFVVMVNYEGIYLGIKKQVTDLGYDLSTSHIDVQHFPTPRIQVKNITIDDMISAESVEVMIAPLSVLSLNPEISSIKVSNVRAYVRNTDFTLMGHSKIIREIYQRVPYLPKMRIEDVSIVNQETKDEERIDLIKLDPASQANQVHVKHKSGKITKVFFTDTVEGKKVTIDHEGASYALNIMELYRGGKLQEGVMRYKIDNLKNFFDEAYAAHDFFVTEIVSEEPMEITANYDAYDTRISLHDVKINSKSVDMVGEMDLYNSEVPDNIILVFNNLDLSTLMAYPNLRSIDLSRKKPSIFLNGLERKLLVKGKQVKIGDTFLDDFRMDMSIGKNSLKIRELKADIRDKGRFDILGDITQNEYRSMFRGNLDFKHSNLNEILRQAGFDNYATDKTTPFVFKTDLAATPIDYEFYNSFLKVGDYNVDGSASVKFIGTMPRVNIGLSASSLDLFDRNHPILSNLVSYMQTLATESKSNSYLKKYIPLREVGFLGNIDLTFNDLVVGSETIDKLRIMSEISPGNLRFNSIYYQDENNYLSGVAHLSAQGVQPQLRFNVGDSIFHTDKFNVSNIFKVLSKIKNEHDLGKINISGEFFSRLLKRPGGDLENFYIKVRNNDILWNIDSLKSKFAGGTFESAGSLKLDKMTLNLSYAYNNFNLKKFSSVFPLQIFGIRDGQASANGVISTYGESLEGLLYNLHGKTSFQGRQFKLDNLSIDTFAEKISNLQYDSKALLKDKDIMLRGQKGTLRVVDGDISLAQGTFKLSDLDFQTTRSVAKGDALYNIYDSKMGLNLDYLFNIRSRYGAGRQVKVGYKASGQVLKPEKSVNLSDVEEYFKQNQSNAASNFQNPASANR